MRAWKRPSPRHTATAAAVVLAAVGAALAAPHLHGESGSIDAAKARDVAAVRGDDLKERFAVLSARHTNQCSLRPESIGAISVNGRLQGSCCGPMIYDQYVRQVKGLRAYARVPEIPADPYDVSVAQAKRLISYGKSISLSPAQQGVYDRAMKLSHEHGPCCCHCWRWTAFQGQANYLISHRRYSAAQIAHVWNLEDGCGGPGHRSM